MDLSIYRRIEKLEDAQKDLKTSKEMLDDMLANDEDLQGYKTNAEEATKRFKLVKEALLGEPEARKLVERIKEIQDYVKLIKSLLSEELLAYYHESGKLVLEVDSDTEYRINFNGNVKRKVTETEEDEYGED